MDSYGRYGYEDDSLSDWGDDYDAGMEGSLRDRVEAAREADDPTPNQERLLRLVQGMTPSQYEAATYDDAPLLILAGAGTGKTRTLTVRIALLVTGGLAQPSEILALTFTNKAAAEMRNRISTLLELEAVAVHATTFHAFCARMLRDYGGEAGWKTDWSILDQDDVKKMMRLCWKEAFGSPPDKDQLLRIEMAHEAIYVRPSADVAASADDIPADMRAMADAYQARKEADNVKDFDDLIREMIQLLETCDGARSELQKRFKYVLVDEYQDTDARQERLLELLMGDNRKLTVVGDEDQLVYTWRHAQIENILGFQSRWGAEIIKLEQNFRSTGNILSAANRLVGFNHKRLHKKLYTYDEGGDTISQHAFDNPLKESFWIVDQVERDIAAGVPREEIAILSRAGHALNFIEQALNQRGIRYTLSGGKKFQDRQEIKDISAYLRLISNAQDRMAFERAIATPKRNVGPQLVEDIDQAAKRMRTDTSDAARRLALGGIMPQPAREPVLEFCRVMKSISSDAIHGEPADVIVTRLINETGYGTMLNEAHAEAKANGSKEEADAITVRLSNLSDLVAIGRGKNLTEFLDHLGLTESARRDDSKGIWIGTIHAAKGLEFLSVYLPAWEQGVLPSNQTIKAGLDLEEERRLAYVAITRARRKLSITRSAERFDNASLPSVFLADLGLITRPSGDGYEIVAAPADEVPLSITEDYEEVPF